MLPMGTIVTVCMLMGLLFATRLPFLRTIQRLPLWLKRAVSVVVFAAGFWNVFWYALRHLTEFWGQAALVSGCLMLVTSAYIFDAARLPPQLNKIRPVVLLLLLACFLLYGLTIYRM